MFDAEPRRAERLRQHREIWVIVVVNRGIAFAVEQLLPLPHHPQIHVVDDENLEGQLQRNRRHELLNRHDVGTVAVDVDDSLVRTSELRADGGGQTKPHRAEAAGVEPLPRLREFEILRRPHLVLSDIRNDDGIAVMLINLLDDILRHHLVALLFVFKRIFLLPFLNLRAPCIDVGSADLLVQFSEDALRITDDRHIYRDILPDARCVNVNVDFFGVRREFAEVSRNPVIESGTDSDD